MEQVYRPQSVLLFKQSKRENNWIHTFSNEFALCEM